MQECYWCEPDLTFPADNEVYQTAPAEDLNKKWSEFGKKWSGTVHSWNGQPTDVLIEEYYEFMQALWRKKMKETRKSTRVTVNGEIRIVANKPVSKGINIMFISEQAMTMKGLHVDKEIMITLSGTQPEVVRGVITEKLTSVKGFVILIKEKDKESISQILSFSPDVTGELEPVDRDTFGLQLDLLVANPEGKLSDPNMRSHILQHNGLKVMGKLVSHEEVIESTHPGLNNSQSEIVRWAGSLKGIGLLFGPPGTGKTHTAAEIVLEWARMNQTNEKLGAIYICGRHIQCGRRRTYDEGRGINWSNTGQSEYWKAQLSDSQ
jgi:hypothetical protein